MNTTTCNPKVRELLEKIAEAEAKKEAGQPEQEDEDGEDGKDGNGEDDDWDDAEPLPDDDHDEL